MKHDGTDKMAIFHQKEKIITISRQFFSKLKVQ